MNFFYILSLSFSLLFSLKCSAEFITPSFEKLYEISKENEDFIIQARRDLHMIPELSHKEFKTSNYIKNKLNELNVNFTGGWGKNTLSSESDAEGTGIVAQIGTGYPPTIGLRADFDALPINESNNLQFKSIHPNVMHACGHDAHAAMLLGAAKIFKQFESQMKGTVRLLFQPAEEGGAGAKFMTDEGCLSKFPPIERIFGIHVDSSKPTGVVSTSYDPITAASQDFQIIVKGKGGHAAEHHETIDPLPAALSIIRSLYDMYTREMYYQLDTAGLISITYVNSGSGASNVIPDQTIIKGTLRAPKTHNLTYMRNRLIDLSNDIAKAYRCETIHSKKMVIPYPSTENNHYLVDWSRKIFNNTFFNGINITPGSMIGEDFAFYSQEVPATFFMIGSGSGSEIDGHINTNEPHHNEKFAIDERMLKQGTAIHLYLAFQGFDDILLNKKNEFSDNKLIDEL